MLRRADGAATRIAGDKIEMDWRTLLRWGHKAIRLDKAFRLASAARRLLVRMHCEK